MNGLADLLFPEFCEGCSVPVRGGLCNDCLLRIPCLGNDVCSRCGRPSRFGVFRCPDCYRRAVGFDRARQAVEYTALPRRLVHQFKYLGRRSAGVALSRLIAPVVLDDPGHPEILTWVAPGARRLHSGIDHGRILAELVAEQTGIACAGLTRRVRPTPRQMTLSPQERRRVLAGAFSARPVEGLRVLVVDDVFTTGATVSEVGKALKRAGAASVHVVCAARAIE